MKEEASCVRCSEGAATTMGLYCWFCWRAILGLPPFEPRKTWVT